MRFTRPVWAEINLDNLANNIREVRRVTRKEALVTAVIKADGYGHGAVQIGETLLANGADRFAVATLSEAIQLRKNFKDVEILVLGYTPNELADEVLKYNLIQTLFDRKQAEYFSEYARQNEAIIKIHIKLDTGMSRLGFLHDEKSIEDLKAVFGFEGIEIEGIYTHFACADDEDKTITHNQVANFNRVVSAIEDAGFCIPIKHVSNSAAIIDMPEYNFDMVRAGIMLYGLYPSKEVIKSNVNLKEVMSLRCNIAHVKELNEGVGVSYGHIYTTSSKETIATLPLGYADGYTRMLTNKAEVIVGGKKVSVVGRICMDQCMISIADGEAKQGDEVILFGEGQGHRISIDDVADKLGTINYEVVCMINKRVPRVYKKDNKLLKINDMVQML